MYDLHNNNNNLNLIFIQAIFLLTDKSILTNLTSMPNRAVLSLLSFFFLIWGGTRSLRMPALRPAAQAGPMQLNAEHWFAHIKKL